MKFGKDHLRCRTAFFRVYLCRYAPAVVYDGAASIEVYSHVYILAITRKTFIHTVVNCFVNQVVKPLYPC